MNTAAIPPSNPTNTPTLPPSNRWKWLGLLAGFFVLIVFVILPFVLGFQVQKYDLKAMQQLAQQYHFQYELLNYERGWYSSQAKFNITFNNSNQAVPALQPFQVTQVIQHGPWISPDSTLPHYKPWGLTHVMTTINNPEIQGQVEYWIPLHRPQMIQIQLDKIQFEVKDVQHESEHLQWLGQDLNLILENVQGQWKPLQQNIGSLSLQTTPLFSLNALRFSLNFKKMATQFLDQDQQQSPLATKTTIEEISLNRNEAPMLAASAVELTQTTVNNPTTFDIHLTQHADKVQIFNFDLGAADSTLHLQLDPSATQNFINTFRQQSTQMIDKTTLPVDAFIALLQKGVLFDFKQQINSSKGPLIFTSESKLPVSSAPLTLATFKQNLAAQAKLTIPHALAETLTAYFYNFLQGGKSMGEPALATKLFSNLELQEWIGIQLFQQQGDQLITELRFENGQLQLNGRTTTGN